MKEELSTCTQVLCPMWQTKAEEPYVLYRQGAALQNL